MSKPRKRNRPDDWSELEPSPVLHIRELPEHTLEIDLLKIFEQYGSVKDISMMPHRAQALIEFMDIGSAETTVTRCLENPLVIANHCVRVNYSAAKHIIQRFSATDSGREYTDGPRESRVLLFTIYNAQYPITVDVIHQITSRHGRVLRIVIFQKALLQAMVEFKSVDDARNAKQHLNGADIYSGCCTVRIEFARPTRLTVVKNDQETWDFENPNPSADQDNYNRPKVSLLGRFSRGHGRHSPQTGGDGYGSSDGYSNSRHKPPPMCFSPQSVAGNILDQLALTMNPQLSAVHPADDVPVYGRPTSTVVMVYNMQSRHMNCDRLFNILCLYGNVVRIKFLRSKEGSAMAQLSDLVSVDRTIKNLNGAPMFDSELSIQPSKQLMIMDVPKPFDLPDGTPSYKDYSSSRENRFINLEKAMKNRIYPPSPTLHYWNCPPNYSSKEICSLFADAGVRVPMRVAEFTSMSERSSSGFVEWDETAEAMEALAFANHCTIPNTHGRFPFVLKLSFSNTPIRERAHSPRKPQSSRKPLSSSSESHYR